jgi:hypothetical protein
MSVGSWEAKTCTIAAYKHSPVVTCKDKASCSTATYISSFASLESKLDCRRIWDCGSASVFSGQTPSGGFQLGSGGSDWRVFGRAGVKHFHWY